MISDTSRATRRNARLPVSTVRCHEFNISGISYDLKEELSKLMSLRRWATVTFDTWKLGRYRFGNDGQNISGTEPWDVLAIQREQEDQGDVKHMVQGLLDNDFDGAHPVSETGKQESINRDLRGGRGVATTRPYQECFRNAVDSTTASLHTAIESFCMGVDSCLISRDLPSDWIATQVLRVIEYHSYTMTTGAYRQTTTRAYGFVDPILPDPGQIINLGLR
ncbi:hypothetical protein B0O80DRAFT_502938 [Mortierella sp. GBAus27b]|nr:hypothetical protein B0O80DRAFT_502938 [Mortierella sp. GBAus27b]